MSAPNKSLITPQVTGAIVAIHVRGQKVKAGDPLFDIDPSPTRSRSPSPRASLEAAKVEFGNLKSAREQRRPDPDGRGRRHVRQADFDRKNELATSRSGTYVDRDTSAAALIQAKQILEFVR